MTFPDFLTWAQNILTRARQYGTAEREIERGLGESFHQGEAYGYRRGYAECEQRWWREQDEKLKEIDDNKIRGH